MAVSVSLESLVAIAGSRPLWPEKFRDLIATLELNPNDDRTIWLALADWCQEEGEPGLEEACRLVGKRVQITAEVHGVKDRTWSFRGLPKSVHAIELDIGPPFDTRTLAGALAMLAAMLRKRREEWE